MIDCGGREDEIRSITEDDLYMYNVILYSQKETMTQQQIMTSLHLSHLSLLTDSEIDDGSVHLSNDYYCSNIGSAGNYSESQTDTSRTISVSSTFTANNDNV